MPNIPEFLDASEGAYYHYNSNVGYSSIQYFSPELNWKPLEISSAATLGDGFFAIAYEDVSGNIVIAFEGTNATANDAFGIGSRAADKTIALGGTPRSFNDAASFASKIAGEFSALSLYVTGHSLGGAEAEYAVLVTPQIRLGMTFAAPGVPFNPQDINFNVINYVDKGDAVGNFADDTYSTYEYSVAVSVINIKTLSTRYHVGTVQFIGDQHAGDVNGNVNNIIASGLLGGAINITDHSLENTYYLDLGFSPTFGSHAPLDPPKNTIDTVGATIANPGTISVGGGFLSGTIDVLDKSYDVAVGPNSASTGTIVTQGAYAGTPVDKDWYRFSTIPGTTYTLTAVSQSVSSGQVALSVKDLAGNTFDANHNGTILDDVADSATGTSTITFTATGTQYYAAVSAGGADGVWQFATGNYRISVTGGGSSNHTPVANDDSYSTSFNATLTRTAATGVLANDTDQDNNPLTAILLSNPTHGSLSFNSNGSFTYTPTTGYSGTDSFTYLDSDGTTTSNNATVSIAISSGSATPTISIAALDASKAEGSSGGTTPFTFTIARSGSTSGTNTIQWQVAFPDNNPNDATGSDFLGGSFPNGLVTFNPGDTSKTIAVNVVADSVPETDEPFAVVLSSPSGGATIGTGTANGLIINDDSSGTAPTVTQITVAIPAPSNGNLNAGKTVTFTLQISEPVTVDTTGGVPSLTLNDGGVAVYTSGSGTSALTFVYTVTAGDNIGDLHETGIVIPSGSTIKDSSGLALTGVFAVDTLLVIDTSSPTIGKDNPLSIQTGATQTITSSLLSATDNFGSAAQLSYTVTSGTSNGTLLLNGAATNSFSQDDINNNRVSYHETASGATSDTFFFKVTDAAGNATGTAPFQINITGGPIDHAPVANNDSYTTSFNTALVVAASGVLANDTDQDGNSLTVVSFTSPSHGSISNFFSNGAFTYTPTSGYSGPDSFTYFANDGTVNSASAATVSITVGANPSVSINDVSITEGNSGTKVATFTVTRSGGTAAFDVNFNTSDNTATTADHDYVANAGTLHFDAGVNTQTVSVTINGDTKLETSETFVLDLSGATNGATISDSHGIGTIINDDGAVPSPDFNADLHGDLLFRTGNGSVPIWEMNGTQVGFADYSRIGSTSIGAPDPSWHIVDTGDFDGDGRSDLLWQTDGGSVAVWEMSATQIKAADYTKSGPSIVGAPGPDWHLLAAADFDGDGHSDLLWKTDGGKIAIWEMNGSQIKAADYTKIGSSIVGAPAPDWHIIGSGDFDGDGNADLLWRTNGGQLAIWEMNGTQIKAADYLRIGSQAVGAPDASWHFVTTGDFDGDGHSDLLWRTDGGQVAIWEMNGTQIKAADYTRVGSSIVGSPDPHWQLAGAADVDGNGTSDLLWQTGGGNVAMWEMNGTHIGAADYAKVGGSLAGTGLDWSIVQHHYDVL